MQEKDVKLKSIEESLQTARDSCSAREKMAEVSPFLCYSFWIFLPSFFLFMLHSAESDLLFWILFILQTLEQQLAALKTEMEEQRQAKVSEEQSRSAAQLQELQAQLVTQINVSPHKHF